MPDIQVSNQTIENTVVAPELRQLFEHYISESMDELPTDYIKNLNNVAIILEDEPSPQNIMKLKLSPHSLLLGLYEGIPLTERGLGATMALPDKITLFIRPIMAVTKNNIELKEQIKRTLWHEIAHYYGLDHSRIDEIQVKGDKH